MPLDLDKAKELAEKATPGPWTLDKKFGVAIWAQSKEAHDYENGDELYNTICTLADDEYTANDGAFIIFSRDFIPAAISEIEALRKRLELAEAVLYLQDGGKIDEYERAREAWRQAKGGGG